MNRPQPGSRYAPLDRLRTVVAEIGGEIACLSRDASPEDHRKATIALIASWAELVQLLAVDPVGGVRECPACEQLLSRSARQCRHCWELLSPLPPGTGGVFH